MKSPAPITQLLRDFEKDRSRGADRLAEAVHARLLAIAKREYRARYGDRDAALTIEPGVLADDALLKLLESNASFEDRHRLFAYATKIIVNALISYQRKHAALRRGGDMHRVTLSGVDDERGIEVEQLPPILDALERFDERKAMIVKLRVFWGMSVPEAAKFMDVSPSTVDREWRFARNWIARRLPDRAASAESPAE